jgi:heterodisulfide reductase subunit D
MKEMKKTNLSNFRDYWTLCSDQCGSCYVHGPFVPHNYIELPPAEWSPPFKKCPSFEYFKFKAYTALGRGNLAGLIFDDKHFPITDELIKIVYTCTSCGMCSEICRKTQPLTAIWALREELVRRGVQLPEPLPRIEANIEKYHNMFGAQRAPKITDEFPSRGVNIYFAGCQARFQHPEVVRASLGILKAAGMETAYLGDKEGCCGFIPGHDGNTQLLEERAEQNVEALKSTGAKRVIVSCAHCYKTLKIDYPLIFGDLPFEVVSMAEQLAQLIDEKKIEFKNEIKQTITYHDPCFLGRHGNIYNEPRKVLNSIPGIKLTEMKRSGMWSYCCGSGAKITANCYPEFTAVTTRERLIEGKETADTLVTACTTCFAHMDKTVKKEGLDMRIIDLPVMVAEAMGIK